MYAVQPIDIQYTYRLLLNIVDAVCYQSAVMVDDIICFSNSLKSLRSEWFLTFIRVLMCGTFMNVHSAVANANQQMHTRARRCNQQQLCYCASVSQLAHTKTQPGCVC